MKKEKMSILFVLCFILFINIDGLKIFENGFNGQYTLFQHRTALFGEQNFNISGTIIPLKSLNALNACNIEDELINSHDYSDKIIIVQRGLCSFVDKAYNIQKLNGKGIIIGNYDENDDIMDEDEYVQMEQDPNDTRNIIIPSIFITYNTYKWILNKMEQNDQLLCIIDTDAEYIEIKKSPWLSIFGIFIVIIPSIWCAVVIIAVLKRGIMSIIGRYKRSKKLKSIPLITYTGLTKNETEMVVLNTNKSEIVTPKNSNDNNKIESPKNPLLTNIFNKIKQIKLNNLYKKSIKPHNDNCAICLDDFTFGEKIKLLPCRHGFHADCIDPWLKKSSELCPMCKQSIFINHNKKNNIQNNNITCINKYICCPSFTNNTNGNNNNSNNNNNNSNISEYSHILNP